MRAKVTGDHTIRTIKLGIQDAPDIDVTKTWHRKPRVFRPYRAVLTVEDGQATAIEVSGGIVLKSGEASATIRERTVWYADDDWRQDRIASAPGWVRLIWDETPAGHTSWGTPPNA